MTKPTRWPGILVALMLACASIETTVSPQAGPSAAAAQSQKTIVDQAISLWNDGNCDAAIAEFEKRIAADPDNLALHAAFARAVSRSRYRPTACRQVGAVRALYDRWIGERPDRAAYLYGAALFLDSADAARKEALLLRRRRSRQRSPTSTWNWPHSKRGTTMTRRSSTQRGASRSVPRT